MSKLILAIERILLCIITYFIVAVNLIVFYKNKCIFSITRFVLFNGTTVCLFSTQNCLFVLFCCEIPDL